MKAYKLESWLLDDNKWCARVDFAFPGLGNTPHAEQIKHNGLRSAKRELRRKVNGSIRYEIIANKIDSLNRLHSLTITARQRGQDQ